MAGLEFRQEKGTKRQAESRQQLAGQMTLGILDFFAKHQMRILNQISRLTTLFACKDAKSVIHVLACYAIPAPDVIMHNSAGFPPPQGTPPLPPTDTHHVTLTSLKLFGATQCHWVLSPLQAQGPHPHHCPHVMATVPSSLCNLPL